MIIKCQYTGIEFKSTSRKQHNHPEVVAFLNAAFNVAIEKNDNAFDAAKDILINSVALGGGIEQIMHNANAAFGEWLAANT